MCRSWGSSVTVSLDAQGKPSFRRSDLSPREEMEELRKEIDRLEGFRRMTTQETLYEFPDLRIANDKHIADLKKRLASLDFVFNDSAPARPTLASVNQRNTDFWKGRVYGGN
jgi:hypothetical protein